ncbi:MAG: FHA domain-containing protein [Candidatus Geothermincolia bacterium]
MFCNKCGSYNPKGSLFCNKCGASFEDASTADTTMALPAIEVETEEDVEVTISEESLAAGGATLVMKRGPEAGTRFVIDREVVSAGRHPESDVFLDDITVSRRHAEIVHTDEGFEMVDVGSLNGTYVNRERIDRVKLKNGDEIQIGKFKLLFFTASG